MASVFLSYDRDDTPRAREFAQALEKAGHEVWWDLHVRGGAQFSKVIEEALKAATAVVVLWSKHSVESPWVRDEAAAGRDSGRLIPVALDQTEPPLGFRQFQTIDLSTWKGRGKSPQLQTLLDDVAAMGGEPKSATAAAEPRPASAFRLDHRSIAAILLLLIAAGLIGWRMIGHSPTAPVVAVSSADPSAASQGLARDLLVKLGSLQTANSNSIDLVGQSKGTKPTLIMQVGGAANGETAEASLALIDPRDSSLLWAKDFPQHRTADLKQQVAYTGAQVLRCALEGLDQTAGHLSRQEVKTYLAACATMADPATSDMNALVPALRKLVRNEPRFSGGWAKLLLAESNVLTDNDPAETSGLRLQLARDIAEARKSFPDLAEAYAAEFTLIPDGHFVEQSQLLDRAIGRDPYNPGLRATRSAFLGSVGRMDDALEDARSAVQLDPLSPGLRDRYITALAFAGRLNEALAELSEAERLWPGATSLRASRYVIQLRVGDPRDALRLLHAGVLEDTETAWIRVQESFLEARIDRSPAKIEKAIQEASATYSMRPDAIVGLTQTLAEFGRKDEVIRILMNWRRMDIVSYATDVLFRPAFRDVHADPRFIRVAQHLGLLNYWQTTGKWPNFCLRRDLPYDCKKQAARLTA